MADDIEAAKNQSFASAVRAYLVKMTSVTPTSDSDSPAAADVYRDHALVASGPSVVPGTKRFFSYAYVEVKVVKDESKDAQAVVYLY